MSQRIQELAQHYNEMIDPGNHFVNQQLLEDFAEAVVRECVQNAGWTQGMAGTHILEHFGLEKK